MRLALIFLATSCAPCLRAEAIQWNVEVGDGQREFVRKLLFRGDARDWAAEFAERSRISIVEREPTTIRIEKGPVRHPVSGERVAGYYDGDRQVVVGHHGNPTMLACLLGQLFFGDQPHDGWGAFCLEKMARLAKEANWGLN